MLYHSPYLNRAVRKSGNYGIPSFFCTLIMLKHIWFVEISIFLSDKVWLKWRFAPIQKCFQQQVPLKGALQSSSSCTDCKASLRVEGVTFFSHTNSMNSQCSNCPRCSNWLIFTADFCTKWFVFVEWPNRPPRNGSIPPKRPSIQGVSKSEIIGPALRLVAWA